MSALFDQNQKVKNFALEQLEGFINIKGSSIFNNSQAFVVKIVGQKTDPIEDIKNALLKGGKSINGKRTHLKF